MKIPVAKYHGCGNDFVIARYQDVKEIDFGELAIKACDRHTGIGADGLIIVQEDPLEMIFYNQDGSRAPMCGNGIRCFSAYCTDEKIVEKDKFTVSTLAGNQEVEIIDHQPFFVRIDMGTAKDDLNLIGIQQPIWGKEIPLSPQEKIKIYSLFMGTIHTVVFVEQQSIDMERVGKMICEHPCFQYQTNVNFVTILNEQEMRMRTYERGCGMTLACGTGACASLVCANRLNKMGNHAKVLLPKGELLLSIETNGHVMMSGPAIRIMKGEYEYEDN